MRDCGENFGFFKNTETLCEYVLFQFQVWDKGPLQTATSAGYDSFRALAGAWFCQLRRVYFGSLRSLLQRIHKCQSPERGGGGGRPWLLIAGWRYPDDED